MMAPPIPPNPARSVRQHGFTLRPFGHTFLVWRRGLALVQFLVVQASLASFGAVSKKELPLGVEIS